MKDVYCVFSQKKSHLNIQALAERKRLLRTNIDNNSPMWQMFLHYTCFHSLTQTVAVISESEPSIVGCQCLNNPLNVFH